MWPRTRTQETFARAFEHWDRFDPPQPLGPWLHTIAARVSLDALRRQRVRSLLGMGRPAFLKRVVEP